MRLWELVLGRKPEIVEAWLERARRLLVGSRLARPQLIDHLPDFLEELGGALRAAEGLPSTSLLPERSRISQQHGPQRERLGIDIGAVVAEFGILSDVIYDLAAQEGLDPTPAEGKLLARCLSTGVRDSAEQYTNARDEDMRRQSARHFGFIAHELRNPLQTVRLAWATVLQRLKPARDTAVDALERGLCRLQQLIDDTLVELRLQAGPAVDRQRVALRALLEEARLESLPHVEARRDDVRIECPQELALECDPRVLLSAITNLLRNAVKFSKEGAVVQVRARSGYGRVVVEVEDECGGIPDERVRDVFDPFVQAGHDRSGFGLGLAIAKQSAEAHGGTLRVTNVPGKGCIFTLDLPGGTPPPAL